MNSKDIDLISRISALRADRQKHAEAISKIDSTLLKIADMLSTVDVATAAGSAKSGLLNPSAATAAQPRRYQKFELTGAEFVLELLRLKGSATTLEINRAWRTEGRGGVANNTIGRLLAEGSILREGLENQRGSSYRLNSKARGAAKPARE